MAKLPFLIFTSVLIAAPLAAQEVRGVVLDDSTHQPIPAATVQLVTAKAAIVVGTAMTDSTGRFQLRPGSAGSYLMRAAHPSYRSTETRGVTLRAAESISVEVRLSRTAIPIEPLVVRARTNARLAGFYERARRGGFGYFVTRQQIEERGAVHQTTDILRSIPSIDIVPVKRGLSAPNVYLIRGRGGCQPAIFLDGIPVQQSVDGGVDDFLKPDMVEGIEVYTSSTAVPQEFSRPTMCGAIAFWTRAPAENGLGKFTLLKFAGGISAVLLLIVLTK